MINIQELTDNLLKRYPIFNSIIINTPIKVDNSIKTACTNGLAIMYNEYYLNSLSLDEQEFVFAHEICHIAFDHINKSYGKDPEIYNIVTDAVINAKLSSDGLKQPKNTINILEASYYDVDTLYQQLITNKYQVQRNNQVINNHNRWLEGILHRIETLKKLDTKEQSKEYFNSIQYDIDSAVFEFSSLGEQQVFENNKEELHKEIGYVKHLTLF